MGRRIGKKRIIIGATIGIALTIIATLGIGTIKVVNANKITSSLELGIKYLKEEEYDFSYELCSNMLCWWINYNCRSI